MNSLWEDLEQRIIYKLKTSAFALSNISLYLYVVRGQLKDKKAFDEFMDNLIKKYNITTSKGNKTTKISGEDWEIIYYNLPEEMYEVQE